MKTYVVFDWVNASLENGDLNPDCGVKEMTEEQKKSYMNIGIFGLIA